MKPIKIAQVGTGHDHAGVTFECLQRLTDCFAVVGVAETNQERLAALERPPYRDARHYSLAELLEMKDLEAVAVESDEDLATEIAQKFVERGVAVHLDKPGTAGVESFARLIETARAQSLPLQMGYMYRYNPAVKRALEMVRAGKLGEIYAVEAQMSVHHPVEKRRWLEKYQGGMMYFLGCHLVDLILQIQGMPEEILPMNVKTGFGGAASEDYGFAVLKYPRGISFIKTCAVELNGFHRRQLVICGSEGTIEIKPLEVKYAPNEAPGTALYTKATALTQEGETDCWRKNGEDWEMGPHDRYDDMMREFARVIRGEIENPYSYDYEMALFQAVMRCCGIQA